MKSLKAFTQKLTQFKIPKIYEENDPDRWSLTLFVVAAIVFVLQKISVFENLKKRVVVKGELAPAILLEAYLCVYWIGTVLFLLLLDQRIGWLSLTIIALSIAQAVQANVYHEFLRPAYRRSKDLTDKVAHSRLRSFLLGMCNYCFVTTLFGFAYWINAAGFGAPAIGGLRNCIYFSFTYAWSAGSRSVSPESIDWMNQAIIVTQIITTLFLVAALISTAVASLRPVEERERKKNDVEEKA